jgi:protein TonB
VAAPQKVRVSSGVAQGNLINHPSPQYPAIARQARISGQVVLAATISKNGSIENLHVISGHPMLTQAALDAVRQWRYKPYMLNGEPTEVETTVTVNFNLGG